MCLRAHGAGSVLGLLVLSLLFGCRSPIPTMAVVERVIDGDTIKLANGTTVRYIGVDTPETVHPQKPVQFMGKEASAFNKRLVLGKTIHLEYDVERVDKYGRTLVYVYVDSVFINAELMREGYAQVLTIPPNVQHARTFLRLQREAQSQRRGLWNEGERRRWESARSKK